VFFDDVRILTQGGIHVGEDDTQLLQILAHLVIDGFTLVLSGHPCQVFLLSLWNAQAIKVSLISDGIVVPGLPLLPYGF